MNLLKYSLLTPKRIKGISEKEGRIPSQKYYLYFA